MNMYVSASPPRAEKSPGLVQVALTTEHLAMTRLQSTGDWLLALADSLAGERLEVDLSGVHFLSSESLGKLVALHSRVRKREGRLVVTGVADPIREVFEVTHLHRLLDIREGAVEGDGGRHAS